MAQKRGVPATEEDHREALAHVEKFPTISEAADALNISRGTMPSRVTSARAYFRSKGEPEPSGGAKEEEPIISIPTFPDESLSPEEVVDWMTRRFEKKKVARSARKWPRLKVNAPGPLAFMWLGDPHVDDDGCDWPTLRKHLEIIQSHPNIKGCSLGDMQNAWIGRLARLWAHQDTSQETAQQLVRWVIANMDPAVLIRGNHDEWLGQGDPLLYVTAPAVVENWRSDFVVEFPNKREVKIVAAHDLPGNSMWNNLHAQLREGKMGVEAHVYLSGHRHNWGLFQTEFPDRQGCVWFARARGYKFFDSYAQRLGHPDQEHGHSIFHIMNPEASSDAGLNMLFSDPEAGADYFFWLRQRMGYDKPKKTAKRGARAAC